jgi:FSR family fosmidomycin resistance protein-like MFS transporter
MRRALSPRLALLAFAHFTIDAYSSFFPPLLPLLMQRLDLSLTRVGALVALASLASSFSQPLFGLVSDRLRRPWFVAVGPLVGAVFLASVGSAPSFGVLLALLMLGGLGVAAFHPQAAVLASHGEGRRSLAMSLFITGGTLGFALGPLYAVTVTGWVGLSNAWIAMVPGLLLGAVLFTQTRRLEMPARSAGGRAPLRELRPVLRPLGLLYAAVVCRSAVSYGFMTFLPIHLHARGWSVESGGMMVTAYLGLGALGGFLGGWLAEHIGGRRVVVLSFVGATPLFAAFLVLPGPIGLPCLVAGAFVLQASLPVNVVLGQELSPRHSSTISSLLMGAAWGVGALLISPIGALADHHGLRAALTVLALLLPAGLLCAINLPAAPLPHAGAAEAHQPLPAD